ncbi:hypothetical protein CCICO_02540 [Corynebacterium ciconiae DSM 44920]|nr:hypothetical protein CCICO_02540 [Corynebacterium ciconiae DSM 44920]
MLVNAAPTGGAMNMDKTTQGSIDNSGTQY